MPNPHTAERQEQFRIANDQEMVIIGQSDLPLMCPNPRSALWASHPRVYLPIEEQENRELRCPYCGTLYRLEI